MFHHLKRLREMSILFQMHLNGAILYEIFQLWQLVLPSADCITIFSTNIRMLYIKEFWKNCNKNSFVKIVNAVFFYLFSSERQSRHFVFCWKITIQAKVLAKLYIIFSRHFILYFKPILVIGHNKILRFQILKTV